MKFTKYLAACSIALLAFGATSCSDFLDKEPENKLPEEEVDYTDVSKMYEPVSGVYARVRTGAMHWIIWPLSIVRDDDMWSGRKDDQQLLVEFGKFNYDSAFWGLNETWNQYYSIIKVANSALISLDNYVANTNDESLKAQYRAYSGEVHFLRAYAYYRLSQMFGDITILRDNNQKDLTRSTKRLVENYRFIRHFE